MLRRVGGVASTAVLVGGQALNFWAEHYRDRVSALSREGPFTSKDIDFCGNRQAVTAFAERLNGRAELPSIDDATPNTGIVRFVDAGGVERVIDFIGTPFGMDANDVARTAIPIELLDDDGEVLTSVRIMHPVRCMESRVHNVMGLPGYDTPHGLRQLRVSVVCAREFLKELLDGGQVRAVLKLNERILEFCTADRHGRTVLGTTGVDPADAILVDPRLPPEFIETRHPQMLAALQRRRTKAPDPK